MPFENFPIPVPEEKPKEALNRKETEVKEILTEKEFKERSEKIKKLFGHCFEISKLDEGDQIPVGGESFLSSENSIKVEGDFENFNKLFEDSHELANKYNLPKLKEWLISKGIEFNEKLFASLFAFTRKFEEKYPENPEKAETRRKIYAEKKKDLKLSDIFNANCAECAEIAAIAQKYLQQEGIASSYFSGDVLWDKNQEFSEEHSFIIIREGDRTYVYDPANPIDTTGGKYPSLYSLEADFDKEMAKRQKRFVTAKNILTKKKAFFGVNDGTNILKERDIV